MDFLVNHINFQRERKKNYHREHRELGVVKKEKNTEHTEKKRNRRSCFGLSKKVRRKE